MLLAEHPLFDQRVLGEAAALQSAGHQVRLIMPGDQPALRLQDGFEVQEVPPLYPTRATLLRLAFTRSWPDALRLLDQSAARPGPVLHSWSPPPAQQRVPARHHPGIASSLKHLARRVLRRTGLLNNLEQIVTLRLEAPFARAARAWQPNLVHAHDLPMLRLGRYLKEQLGCPLVYDAHELYPAQGNLHPDVARFWQQREREDIGAADLRLTVNPLLAEEFTRWYPVTAPEVVHNASPWQDVSSDRPSARATLVHKLHLPPDPCLLFYAGILNQGRALPELLQALALLPARYGLVIVGDGPLRKPAEQLAATLHLQDRVCFLGMLPRVYIPRLAAGADIGLVAQLATGRNEYFCSPNRLSDYLMAGLALALSDLPFLRWTVEHYHCGQVFNTLDPADIARTLRHLGDDPHHLEELRRAALEASREVNWEREARHFLELYSRVSVISHQ